VAVQQRVLLAPTALPQVLPLASALPLQPLEPALQVRTRLEQIRQLLRSRLKVPTLRLPQVHLLPQVQLLQQRFRPRLLVRGLPPRRLQPEQLPQQQVPRQQVQTLLLPPPQLL
jgi:hypothetical protein